MRGKLLAQASVVLRLVGHEAAFAVDVLTHDRNDLGNRRAGNVKATRGAATFNQRQDHVLVVRRRACLGTAFQAADVGFVGFDKLAAAAHGGMPRPALLREGGAP